MEYWDVYDENKIKKNKSVIRGEESYGNNTLDKDEFHLVVHICIFNTKGQMLIQKRQSFKNTLANMWDLSVGGSVQRGESAKEAAIREVREEIGYKVDLDKAREHFCINFDKGFDNYYLLIEDLDIEKLTLQYEEVQSVKWATREEIHKLIEMGEFVPYYKELIDLIFKMKDRGYGSHTKNI